MRRANGNQVCVFCGSAIEPGQEYSGRGEAMAHAECADRALADDQHWDRIAAQSGEDPVAPAAASGGRRRAGCLTLPMTIGAVLLIGLALVA